MKGAVAEDGCRRAFGLVKRNNIRFTVAFAESYRKTEPQGAAVRPISDFLVAEQSAIFYCRKVKNYENPNF